MDGTSGDLLGVLFEYYIMNLGSMIKHLSSNWFLAAMRHLEKKWSNFRKMKISKWQIISDSSLIPNRIKIQAAKIGSSVDPLNYGREARLKIASFQQRKKIGENYCSF
mgnify:FL=1